MEPDLTNCVLNTEAPYEPHWLTILTVGELRSLLIDRTLDDDVDSARHVARILWMKFVDKFGHVAAPLLAYCFEKFCCTGLNLVLSPAGQLLGILSGLSCVWNEVPARFVKETIPCQTAVVSLTKSKIEQIYHVEEIPYGFYGIFVVTCKVLHVCKIHGNRLLLKKDVIMVLTEEDSLDGDLEFVEFFFKMYTKLLYQDGKWWVSYQSSEAE